MTTLERFLQKKQEKVRCERSDVYWSFIKTELNYKENFRNIVLSTGGHWQILVGYAGKLGNVDVFIGEIHLYHKRITYLCIYIYLEVRVSFYYDNEGDIFS